MKFTELLALIGEVVSKQIERMSPGWFAVWVVVLVTIWRLPNILAALS